MPRSVKISNKVFGVDSWPEVFGRKALRISYGHLYRWHSKWLDCAGDIVNGGYVAILESKEKLEFDDEWQAAKYAVKMGFRAFSKNYRNNKKVGLSINDNLNADGFTLEQTLTDATDLESNLFANDTKLDLMQLVGQTGDELLLTLTHLLLNGLSPVEIAKDMGITTLQVMRIHRNLTDLAVQHKIGTAAPKLKLTSHGTTLPKAKISLTPENSKSLKRRKRLKSKGKFLDKRKITLDMTLTRYITISNVTIKSVTYGPNRIIKIEKHLGDKFIGAGKLATISDELDTIGDILSGIEKQERVSEAILRRKADWGRAY